MLFEAVAATVEKKSLRTRGDSSLSTARALWATELRRAVGKGTERWLFGAVQSSRAAREARACGGGHVAQRERISILSSSRARHPHHAKEGLVSPGAGEVEIES